MSSIKKWLCSFWSVLIRPTPKTFTSITHNVEESFGEAIAWIVFILVIFFVPVSIITDDPQMFNLMVICIIMIPIWVLLFVFLLHRMNYVLFKNNNYCYDELLYATVVIFVITSLLNILLVIFLVSNYYFLYAPVLYCFVLTVISVKAITELSYLQSLLNVTVSLTLSSIGFIFIGSFFMLLIQEIPRFFW